MSDSNIFDVWTCDGRIGRARYFATCLILLGLKHNIDRLLGATAGYPYGLFNYWIFYSQGGIRWPRPEDSLFYLVLLLMAMPFLWSGLALTMRRLRDADLPLWLVLLILVPFLNLIFFVIMSVIPSHQSLEEGPQRPSRIGRLIPQRSFGSAVFGIVITAILAVLEIQFSTKAVGEYGWGLFVGIPFFLGLNSTMVYSFHQPRTFIECLLVSLLSVALVGLALLALAIEGVLCLAMALPIAIPVALIGGCIGYLLQKRLVLSTTKLRVASVVFLLIPGLTLLEHISGGTPPIYESKTSVVIKSDPQTVWKHVITFSQLPPPAEAMFKTGLAYPVRAEMCGQGVGAERHGVFSTGEFVQPITAWDQPHLLAFDVTEQPPSMEETSIYKNVRPPHLENYFVARRGQFELKPLPDGTTLLEGTTWYQNYYWPAAYWHLWSDRVVDGIHKRVLLHIKTLAETSHEEAQKAQR